MKHKSRVKKKKCFPEDFSIALVEFLYFAQLSFPIVINSFINCCTFFDPPILGRKRRNEPSLWPPCPGCALPGAWVPACQEYVADRSHPLLPLTSGRAAHLLLFLIRKGPAFFSVFLTVVSFPLSPSLSPTGPLCSLSTNCVAQGIILLQNHVSWQQ